MITRDGMEIHGCPSVHGCPRRQDPRLDSGAMAPLTSRGSRMWAYRRAQRIFGHLCWPDEQELVFGFEVIGAGSPQRV
jgi:hypothetical protein